MEEADLMAVHEGSIIVNAPVHEVFMMWRNLENFPQYMSNVEEVKMLDGNKSHWRGSVMGVTQEWDAETVEMVEDRKIAWKSVSGFENSGWICFEPHGNGARITVHFEYNPPAGILGDAAESLFMGADFEDALARDLDSFKARVEAKAA
jgi:uncharacterized membrane protein